MATVKNSPIRRLKSWLWGVAALFAGLPTAAWCSPNTNIYAPTSTPAKAIEDLGNFVNLICALIFVVVCTLIIYAAWKFRARPEEEDTEPPQVFGSVQVELSWTIIPVLIIVVLFLATARIIFALQEQPKPATALEVVVVGHQFWWEYKYPTLNISTANELHIPVSDAAHPMPTFLKITSADVVHSFWVPRLAGKTDVIPNRVNESWIDPQQPGLFLGQCAQFCGAQHAHMLLRVSVDTPEQFAAWVHQQQQTANLDAKVAQGRQVFETQACMNCHTISGTAANGRFGPDLTHLASRATIGAGVADNNTENLKRWIANPDDFKPGVLMPPMHLSDEQIDQVTAYLMSLK